MIEVMLAATLLFAVAASMITVCLSNSRLRRIDSERALAFTTCRNQLEEVRSLPFGTIASIDGRGFDVPGSNGGAGGLQPVSGDADGLPGQFFVTTEAASAGEVLHRVRVVVTWQGTAGAQSFALESLIANRGAL